MELFEHLDTLLKTFWYIAIPTSLFFTVQTVLTFVGADATDGVDADFDGDLSGTDAPFQLFSFRNLIHFLLGFSWSGISFYSTVQNKPLLILLSVIVGVLFVGVFFLIIKQMHKLAEDNSFRISSAINKTGEAYIPIPERKSGAGKVTVSINGTVRELDAMTEGERIASGAKVKITGIESNSILLVELIK